MNELFGGTSDAEGDPASPLLVPDAVPVSWMASVSSMASTAFFLFVAATLWQLRFPAEMVTTRHSPCRHSAQSRTDDPRRSGRLNSKENQRQARRSCSLRSPMSAGLLENAPLPSTLLVAAGSSIRGFGVASDESQKPRKPLHRCADATRRDRRAHLSSALCKTSTMSVQQHRDEGAGALCGMLRVLTFRTRPPRPTHMPQPS